MSEPDFLSNSRIAILGLGLMGGSLALALKDRCQAVLAYDPDKDTISQAQGLEIVDQVSSDPAEVLTQANILILAAPINAILEMIKELPSLHTGSAIVLDLGSTKRQIVRAFEALPTRFDPLGGHPMCGKETSGLANAEASIFEGATFAFTPLARTSDKARSFAEQLAQTIGARSLWLNPETHDRWTAATSHLPYLIASALSLATPSEVSPLIGSGYRSTTRVAAHSSDVMLDVLTTNRDNILESIDQFRRQLDTLEGKLSENDIPALKQALDKSASRQRCLTS